MSADTATSRWEAVLAELETDIQRTHEFLVRPPATVHQDGGAGTDDDLGPTAAALMLAAHWTPPTGLGPLPDGLRSRAEAVVNQQRELTKTLNETLVTTRAHLRVAENLRRRNAPQAIYLDTLG